MKPNQKDKTSPTHIKTKAQTQKAAHHAKDEVGRATLGAGAPGAWAPPLPCGSNLRVVACLLGLGLGLDVGWPRFVLLVGLLPFFAFYTFPKGAFLIYSTCIWYRFLQSVYSSSTSGIWLVAKVYVCRNI